jgi:hypothetical protein
VRRRGNGFEESVDTVDVVLDGFDPSFDSFFLFLDGCLGQLGSSHVFSEVVGVLLVKDFMLS